MKKYVVSQCNRFTRIIEATSAIEALKKLKEENARYKNYRFHGNMMYDPSAIDQSASMIYSWEYVPLY